MNYRGVAVALATTIVYTVHSIANPLLFPSNTLYCDDLHEYSKRFALSPSIKDNPAQTRKPALFLMALRDPKLRSKREAPNRHLNARVDVVVRESGPGIGSPFLWFLSQS